MKLFIADNDKAGQIFIHAFGEPDLFFARLAFFLGGLFLRLPAPGLFVLGGLFALGLEDRFLGLQSPGNLQAQ